MQASCSWRAGRQSIPSLSRYSFACRRSNCAGASPAMSRSRQSVSAACQTRSAARRLGKLADKLLHDAVELLRVLHEHEVVAAFGLFKDFHARARDLTADPLLRFPPHQARFCADHQGWDVDARNLIAPIVGGMVVE